MEVQTIPTAIAASMTRNLLTSGLLRIPTDFVDERTVAMALNGARNASVRIQKETGNKAPAEEVFKASGLYNGCEVRDAYSSDRGNTVDEVVAALTANCVREAAAVLLVYENHAVCLARHDHVGYWMVDAPDPTTNGKPSMRCVQSPAFDPVPLPRHDGFMAALLKPAAPKKIPKKIPKKTPKKVTKKVTKRVAPPPKEKEEEEEREEVPSPVITKIEEEEEDEEENEEEEEEKKAVVAKKKRKTPSATGTKKRKASTRAALKKRAAAVAKASPTTRAKETKKR